VIGYAYLNSAIPQPDSLALEDQERTIRRFARERGWALTRLWKDAVDLWSEPPRPLLERIMQDDAWDVLLIARLDCLTRHIRELRDVMDRIHGRSDRRVVSIAEGIDAGNPAGRFCLRLIDIFAAWDAQFIPDRMRALIARRKDRGEFVGHPPFGYAYEKGRLVNAPSEMKTVRLILNERERGNSFHAIARFLNHEKIPSKRGGMWYAETVKGVYLKFVDKETEHPR
jgi:DNA invertase Pin-like site-specific DNA recombinase